MEKLIVILCASVLVGSCIGATIGLCAYKHFGWLRNWIAERDARALLNRQRKTVRNREIFASLIHPSTSYCEYLGTKSGDVPRVRRHVANASPTLKAIWALDDLNDLKASQAQRTIDRMEATPTAAELLRNGS
jgi:hypothetical protein